MNKKLILLSAAIGLLFASATVNPQSAVIRGEVTPGVYEVFKSDGSGRLQVTISGSSGGSATYTQSVITVTSASQQFLAVNTSRKFLFIQNNDATGNVHVNFGATATTAHLKIAPGGHLLVDSAIPTSTITAIGSIASNTNVVLIEGQ